MVVDGLQGRRRHRDRIQDILEELVGEIGGQVRPGGGPGGPTATGSSTACCTTTSWSSKPASLVLPEGPYETLAGFVQTALGRVPTVGDVVEAHGHRFTVVEMDGRRVSRVRIAPPVPTPDDATAPAGPAVAPER